MHAIRRVDLQALARGIFDDFVDGGGTEALARIAVFLDAARDADVRADLAVRGRDAMAGTLCGELCAGSRLHDDHRPDRDLEILFDLRNIYDRDVRHFRDRF